MGEVETYRVARRMRVFVPLIFVFAPIAGAIILVGALRDGETAGVVFVIVWFAVAAAQAWPPVSWWE